MNILAGGSSWTKAIVTLIIIPLIAAATVFFFVLDKVSVLPALGIAVLAFFAVWAIMARVVMMV